MTYREMKERHQAEVNDFLHKFAFFAFNDDQAKEGLAKLGIKKKDAAAKLVSLGAGGYLLKDHVKDWYDMNKRHWAERDAAINDPENGADFAKGMFVTELDNHEYSYTGTCDDAILSLGYSWDDINSNPILTQALFDACQEIRERGADG